MRHFVSAFIADENKQAFADAMAIDEFRVALKPIGSDPDTTDPTHWGHNANGGQEYLDYLNKVDGAYDPDDPAQPDDVTWVSGPVQNTNPRDQFNNLVAANGLEQYPPEEPLTPEAEATMTEKQKRQRKKRLEKRAKVMTPNPDKPRKIRL